MVLVYDIVYEDHGVRFSDQHYVKCLLYRTTPHYQPVQITAKYDRSFRQPVTHQKYQIKYRYITESRRQQPPPQRHQQSYP